jgi:hypothetical protein
MRRRTHRIGSRLFPAAFDLFQISDGLLQKGKLVWIDGDEVARPIVAGLGTDIEEQRRRVMRLLTNLRDNGLDLTNLTARGVRWVHDGP